MERPEMDDAEEKNGLERTNLFHKHFFDFLRNVLMCSAVAVLGVWLIGYQNTDSTQDQIFYRNTLGSGFVLIAVMMWVYALGVYLQNIRFLLKGFNGFAGFFYHTFHFIVSILLSVIFIFSIFKPFIN